MSGEKLTAEDYDRMAAEASTEPVAAGYRGIAAQLRRKRREGTQAGYYGSTYVVWFGSIAIPKPGQEGLISKRIEASTFLAVEDWAHENTPDGYELSEITKVYGDSQRLDTFGGPVDVNLRGDVRAERWNVNTYRGGAA